MGWSLTSGLKLAASQRDVRVTRARAAINPGSPLYHTGSRPIRAFGHGSRHTETGQERKHAAPHTQSHPHAISHPGGCPSSLLTSRPAAAPVDRSCWLSEAGVRQDARWDKHADTRCSAVATRRHPTCKCAALNRACLWTVFLLSSCPPAEYGIEHDGLDAIPD